MAPTKIAERTEYQDDTIVAFASDFDVPDEFLAAEQKQQSRIWLLEPSLDESFSQNLIKDKDVEQETEPPFTNKLELESSIFGLWVSFKVRKKADVTAFLFEHPYLVEILEDSLAPIEKVFGNDRELKLELFHDPEGTDCVELFAIIKTGIPVHEALKRQKQFNKEWWIGHSKALKGKLIFTIE